MRYLLLFTFHIFLLVSCKSISQKKVDEDGIQSSTLIDEGFDTTLINLMTSDIKNQVFPNIHSLLILRHNKLVYEQYWPGDDKIWGLSERHHFTKNDLHDMRSVSKSFVSACIGIALLQGKIKSIDEKVLSFFPEYAQQDTGMKSLITIRHLLTMTSGLVWNETIPYTDDQNGEMKMADSQDMTAFVLSQPMDHMPGTYWNYCAGATHLLSAIIRKTTGKPLDEFARENLFQPLSTTQFEWRKYRSQNEDYLAAAAGLRLRPRDMVKFGLLYANQGKWKDKRIISDQWVEESLKSQIMRDSTGGYGFQFWTWSGTVGNKSVMIQAAKGNGGQYIILDPINDLLIVSTAGNYDENVKDLDEILVQYIYPALKN